jgi:hypothetical protein
VFNIGYVKLVVEGGRDVNSRVFIYFEFLVLWGKGIIESPLLKRDFCGVGTLIITENRGSLFFCLKKFCNP